MSQDLFNALLAQRTEEELRRQVLRGSYRLVDWREEAGYRPGETVAHLFVSGAMVPEAVAAAHHLRNRGILANVFNVTSADLLFHDYLAAQKEKIGGKERNCWVEELVSPGRYPASSRQSTSR